MRQTQMRFVVCIVHEHQLWLYGHVAHFSDTDPAHQILSAREPHECRRPMGRPHPKWKEQVIGISRRWGWARHLPGGWPDRGHWSTSGKWKQRRTAPIFDMLPYLTGPNGIFQEKRHPLTLQRFSGQIKAAFSFEEFCV